MVRCCSGASCRGGVDAAWWTGGRQTAQLVNSELELDGDAAVGLRHAGTHMAAASCDRLRRLGVYT